MRSRSRKLNRSRVSLLDRVIEPRRKVVLSSDARSTFHADATAFPAPKRLKLKRPKFLTARSASAPNTPSKLKPRPLPQRIMDRLQQPVGIRPIAFLILTWILMLVIIWGAFQEILSLGAPRVSKKQPVTQIERRALVELLTALVVGGVGLSLVLTPALKRAPKLEDDCMVENSTQD